MMNSKDVFLAHHGVLGQKWGVRRYQNPDGTLTPLGRKRLDKQHIGYLQSRSKSRRFKNRNASVDEYYKAEKDLFKKYGLDLEEVGHGSYTKIYDELAKKSKDEYVYDRFWNSFMDKYAEATLKDMKMLVNEKALAMLNIYWMAKKCIYMTNI